MGKIYITAIRASAEGNGGDRSIPRVVGLEYDDVTVTPLLTGASNHIERTVVKVSGTVGNRKTYQAAEKLSELNLMNDFNGAASEYPHGIGSKADVAAAGTAQGTATAVTAYFNSVTAACAGVSLFGVRLPNASTVGNLGRAMVVRNAATAGITVWPSASEILNSASTSSVTIAAGSFKHFYCSVTNKWVSARGPQL